MEKGKKGENGRGRIGREWDRRGGEGSFECPKF